MTKLQSMRKRLNKIGVITELNEPTEWISLGNATINHKMSSRFSDGLPNKRTLLLWGPSGGGKSFLASNACKSAQDKGYLIIYIDTEESISEDYMEKIGIDMDEDKFMPVDVTTIEELTAAISEIFSEMDPDTKFMLVIDSLAGLLTEKEEDEFTKGGSKGDMGQFAKKLKLFVKNLNKKISNYDAFCVMVTHAYQNQDILNGEGRWICTGGKGMQFFPSFSILVEPRNIKNKDNLDGIRMKGKVTKTRFTAPRQEFELNIPYNSGLDFTDGMLPILVKEGTLQKNGGWYSYESPDGKTEKFQENKFMEHYQAIMEIYDSQVEVEEKEVAEDVE